MNGYMTPGDAFLAAAKLHTVGKLQVSVYLRHAPRRHGIRYAGDEHRLAGRTAQVAVGLEHGLTIDELNAARDKVRALGYNAEHDGSDLAILGPWRPTP